MTARNYELDFRKCKKVPLEVRDTVFGFVRQFEKELAIKQTVPDLIHHLCLLYYYENDDKWDTNNLQTDRYAIAINQNVITKTGGNGRWRTVFLSKIVDNGKYEWSFKIKKYAGYNNVMFGIWNNSYDPKAIWNKRLSAIGNRAYAFYSSRSYAELRQHEQDEYGPNYGISLVEGDIITMNIDLDALFLSFNINNKDYGKGF
eukprot:UN13471